MLPDKLHVFCCAFYRTFTFPFSCVHILRSVDSKVFFYSWALAIIAVLNVPFWFLIQLVVLVRAFRKCTTNISLFFYCWFKTSKKWQDFWAPKSRLIWIKIVQSQFQNPSRSFSPFCIWWITISFPVQVGKEWRFLKSSCHCSIALSNGFLAVIL